MFYKSYFALKRHEQYQERVLAKISFGRFVAKTTSVSFLQRTVWCVDGQAGGLANGVAAVCYTGFSMKVLVLYRPNSEHGRLVEEFIRDFQSTHRDERLEILNIDTREGSAMASLYDVVQYPAILVVQSDGYLQRSWEGDNLPLMNEVASYARN
jgi:hypothetical protein